MKTLVTFVGTLAVHLLLGWIWTPVSCALGGYWAGPTGWRVGLLAGAGSWALLMVWSAFVNSYGTGAMLTAMGGILGNMPGVVVVVLTLLLGALLGLLGGLTGQFARAATHRPATA